MIEEFLKKITHLGFVVNSVEKTAIKYEEILGIGPWIFKKIGDGRKNS